MEQLMQYIWQHRLWRSEDMLTNDGRPVRVLDPGLLNTDAGPDFFNAKVEIDGQTWVGNVEIHVRASDWKRHGHDRDNAYDSVVLHVVDKDDAPVLRSNGERIPQLVLQVSPLFDSSYRQLVNSKLELPCENVIASVPRLTITEWIERLAFERLHSKVQRVRDLLEMYHGSWEDVCYVTVARNLGFGINNDAFERLARRTPLRLLHKHSDSLMQIEALLFGQAGMLDPMATGTDTYYQHLCSEYAFLANKFSLRPMEPESWKLFRIRPQNFPYRRIAMLAHYIEGSFRLMAQILDASGEKELRKLFQVELTGYWSNHYSFGKPQERPSLALSNRSIDIVLINTVAPLYYAYGEITGNYALTDKAISLLESLPAEKNSIVDSFARAGIDCDSALTTQALIELRRSYCDARKCIYCKIGHRLLSEAAHRE
ncbi:MAG: DUF2851 family protein [Muribaculaceae bacterium]|nr:DUF2851 family protein [Muribaculaceae bacterium]MBQ3910422.1 DUF2851 family protein [Muribaculaceae bacterium]